MATNRSGGAAPYGYRRTADGAFEPDSNEAPIRKLIFELFLTHKRKLSVAKHLNQKGYRTRSGAKFSDTSIDRLLRDPIVTGHHKDNFLQAKGSAKYQKLKPEAEWRFPTIEPIVDTDTWSQAQELLQGQKKKPIAKKPAAIFANYLACECGAKMHRPHGRRSYFCAKCQNSIEAETLEAIFQEKISGFSIDKNRIRKIIENRRRKSGLSDENSQTKILAKEKAKLEAQVDKIYDLYIDDSISKARLTDKLTPLEARLVVIDTALNARNDNNQAISKIELSSDTSALSNMSDVWGHVSKQSKRQLVEQITQRIDVGTTNIKFTLLYPPS